MKRIARICAFVAGVAVIAVQPGSGQGPTLHPLPFDNTLSVYAAHAGRWDNCTLRRWEQRAEIEDPVAVFQPREIPSDEPDVWADHQINAPSPPTGWQCYEPSEGRPMRLRCVIRDTQRRLGRAVITHWDTGMPVDILRAGRDHGGISGTVSVDPAMELLRVDVGDAGGRNLFTAGMMNPRFADVVVVTKVRGWIPNRGEDHADCPAAIGPPFGDPRVVTAKRSTAEPKGIEACIPRDFRNDSSSPGMWYSPLCAKPGEVRRTVYNEHGGLTVQGWRQLQAAVDAAKHSFSKAGEGFRLVHATFVMTPYSEGTAHFPWRVTGEVAAILYFPYRGTAAHKATVARWIQEKVNASVSGIGTDNVSRAAAASLALEVTPAEKKRWQVGDPVAVADVWGLRVEPSAPPSACPNHNITQPVTIKLHVDKHPITRRRALYGGQGWVVKGTQWTTTVPPPEPTEPQQALRFPMGGQQPGTAVVALGKGWKWTACGVAAHEGYAPGETREFPAPTGVVQVIESKLDCLLLVRVRTEVYAWVTIERRVAADPDVWEEYSSGQTFSFPVRRTPSFAGMWEWTAPLLPKDTLFRVRAAASGGPGEWTLLMSIPSVEHIVNLTVPPPPP